MADCTHKWRMIPAVADPNRLGRFVCDRCGEEHPKTWTGMERLLQQRDQLRADLAARDAEIVVWETFYECARNLDPSLEHMLGRIRLGELSDSTDPRCYQCRWQGDMACAGHPKAGDCDAFAPKALEGQPEPRVVTREMALDAGDPSLEGQPYPVGGGR